MADQRVQQIVIVGGGVAGSALAIHLARAGRDVCVIDRPLEVDLLVGESLLPPTTDLLRDLGVEDEVRSFSVIKPGVAFVMRSGRVLSLNLRRLSGVTTRYAYNVPRPRFDAALRARAVKEGARVIARKAKIARAGDRLELDAETLAAAGLERQPDRIIDATGRARVFGRTLDLDGVPGRRRDTCVFAHYEGVDLGVPTPGCVVLTAMNAGWSWRIPLPDRMSVGVVQDTARLNALGATPEERLARALAEDPIMAAATAGARRLTAARVFTNYQWRYDRFSGENWALVGDAAGFVDPTLSSGVLLALQGAAGLAEALIADDGAAALARWEKSYRSNIAVWQEMVDTFYDGRLFSMIMQGEDLTRYELFGPLNRHMERTIAGAVLGARTTHWYNSRLVRLLTQHGIVRYSPADWAIH